MSFKNQIFFCLIILTIAFKVFECKSYFSIGDRIVGDQLLSKDERTLHHIGLTQRPRIDFAYNIRQPITFVDLLSEDNVHAEVSFSYHDDIVNGSVTPIKHPSESPQRPFTVLIRIYGFNDTILNYRPGYVLNRDQEFNGRLEPRPDDEGDVDERAANQSEKDYNEDEDMDGDEDEEDEGDEEDEEELDDEDEHGDDEYEFEGMDKFIYVGQRQKGDYLLYETYQSSPLSTEKPTNHSVAFYYIDNAYISYIEFVIIDYYVNKSADNSDESMYIAEYSYFTPSTLKATITDHKTTSMFAKMSVYGYFPVDLPKEYVSYIPEKVRNANDRGATTESPSSVLERLRAYMGGRQQLNEGRLEALAFDGSTGSNRITKISCTEAKSSAAALNLISAHFLLMWIPFYCFFGFLVNSIKSL